MKIKFESEPHEGSIVPKYTITDANGRELHYVQEINIQARPGSIECEMKIIAGSGPKPGTPATEHITAAQEDTTRQQIQDEAVNQRDFDNSHRVELAWNSLAESIWDLLSLSMSESADSETDFDRSMASSLIVRELRLPTVRSD